MEKSPSEKSLSDDLSLLDKIKNLTKQIQIFKENTENMNILLKRLIKIKDRDIQSLISTFK
ncbi:hypothetical protein H1R81_08715 [Emticicia sp. BO119]|nr:hypothetical protein [Emticicia sp. BO119]